MNTIFLDGQYFKVNLPIINSFAPGHFKAKGVFETMLGIDGVVLDASLHLKRLCLGLKAIGIKPPTINPLMLTEVYHRNLYRMARVRLLVWLDSQQVHVMVTVLPYKFPAQKAYRVCLIKTKSLKGKFQAYVKSLDYEMYAKAFAQAQAKGFDEALLVNRLGFIFEASRSNIFWVKDDVLYTPPLISGCLNGITRQKVIKEAGRLQIRVKEVGLTAEILKNADSAFLTNSLAGIKARVIDIIF